MRLEHEWSKRDSCPCHKDNTNLFKTIMILCTNCLRRTKKYIILHWHGSAVSCFRHFSYAILYLFDL